MTFQGTVRKRVDFEGIGIHSGERVSVSLLPAPVHTGILFVPARPIRDGRLGSESGAAEGVVADWRNLLFTNNAITVGRGDFFVQTIEHFMASFYALDVTNLYVVVNGNELPIFDGSSLDIVKAILETGIQVQGAVQDVFQVPYPVWIERDGSYLIALPSDEFKITYTIDFTSKSHAIGTQTAHFHIDRDTFIHSLAPARTFGFFEEIEALRSNKLARGGSLENALIYTKDRLLNPDLRFVDECVRHKILDLVGDLSLVGCRLKGHFIAHKSGHTMDMELVKRLSRALRRGRTARQVSLHILRRKEQEYRRFKQRLNLS